MNKVILMGNLARDPESSQTNNGTTYTRFTIAVQRRFANSEGEREADFLNCIAWRQTAEFIAKYFKKGSKICVWGSIQTRSYEQDGQKKYATDIVVEEAEFADSKGSSDSSAPTRSENKASAPAKKAKLEPVEDDDLPF